MRLPHLLVSQVLQARDGIMRPIGECCAGADPCDYHEGYYEGTEDAKLTGGKLLAKIERDQSAFEEFGL